MNEYNYIAIEGVIGAGKTTLSNLLSEKFEATAILEHFEENPYLANFYARPDQYSFQLELSFLAERFQQMKSKTLTGNLFSQKIIADYIIQKSLIFSRITLKEDEYQLYYNLYHLIVNSLPKPDVIVYLYLTPEKAIEQIKSRGRLYEQQIELEYIKKIQDGYLDYFKTITDIPVCIINSQDLDFVINKNDFNQIFNSIFEKTHQKGINYF